MFFKALLVIRLAVELVPKRNRAFARNLPKPLNSGDAAGVCCLNTPGCWGERWWVHMTNDVATDHERYVVEVDGAARAEYGIFVKALRAGLQLKQELPDSRVKLRDANRQPPH